MGLCIQDSADEKVLNLTTAGRRTGLPREIEIWFVVQRGGFHLFAETGETAARVKNFSGNSKVVVRLGAARMAATARVLDRDADRQLCDLVAFLATRKYDWGDGLPVEITPFMPIVLKKSGLKSSRCRGPGSR